MLGRIHQWLAEHYQADPRALSLLRIGTALVVIIDLLIRFPDLEAHYTNQGLWPLDMVRYGWREGYWSFHALNGSARWQLVLFILHFLAAAFLLMGWHTTRATFVTWLLLVSLQNRNVFILQGGDDLLRLTLFTGLFLPWGSHLSVDAATGRQAWITSRYAYLLYLLLIASVYLFSALLKNSADWRSEGSAIYYALSLEQIRLPVTGDMLYRHPHVMRVLTWLVLAVEFLIPLLILIPSRSGKPRVAAFVLIALLHAGIASTLYVGLFPLIGMVTAVGLLRTRRAAAAEAATPPAKALSAALNSVVLLLAAICLVINLQGLPWFGYELHSAMRFPAYALRLDQYWGMFSPSVLRKDGWFVYQGVDSLGREWDLRTGKQGTDFSKPPHIVSMYASDRWRKLAENIQGDGHTFLRPLYAKYVLRKWNAVHPDRQIAWLHLYYMEKYNQPDYREPHIQKVLYCVTDGR